MDEIYEGSVIRFNAWGARACDWLDFWVWNGVVQAVSVLVVGFAWLNRSLDEYMVNHGFDEGCRRLTKGGALMSRLQGGRVQTYLRFIGVALTVLVPFGRRRGRWWVIRWGRLWDLWQSSVAVVQPAEIGLSGP